jgi:crotonobetainyl-CoA:carnitine CoA-transferase CaiB-like acyl-CoA transferase
LHSLFTSRTATELGLIEQVGSQRFVRSPIRTDQDNMAPVTAPPALNQDGRDIMRELGLSEQQMAEVERQSGQ